MRQMFKNFLTVKTEEQTVTHTKGVMYPKSDTPHESVASLKYVTPLTTSLNFA